MKRIVLTLAITGAAAFLAGCSSGTAPTTTLPTTDPASGSGDMGGGTNPGGAGGGGGTTNAGGAGGGGGGPGSMTDAAIEKQTGGRSGDPASGGTDR